jgi:hypothetical protein
MAPAFDSTRLPSCVRGLVDRALSDVDLCEAAIAAIEGHLARQRERPPDMLLALAVLTYEEASQLLLNRIEEAAGRALALVDEAVRAGAPEQNASLARLRARCRGALARERSRERRLLGRLARGAARPCEIVELAHRFLARGDDGLAADLLRRVSRSDGSGRPAPMTAA